ncbi:hypothetical protein DPMN_066204 [Dreissena polymorpha]|uniref:Uncharacterized protein n=1 Tax=Dreissena polymorpha TaxID=45954 RepID=A0A9D3YYI3_DREPO|nr:hypothetical protein DPMN_066204 [Dreissena polymorpha]
MEKLKSIQDLLSKSSSKQALLEIQAKADVLRAETIKDIKKRKQELMRQELEEVSINCKIKQRTENVAYLENEIEGLEHDIKTLRSEASDYDRQADRQEEESRNKSKFGWASIAGIVAGIGLAPATGGISLAVSTLSAGVATKCFMDASELRSKSEANRKDASQKRNDMWVKRENVKSTYLKIKEFNDKKHTLLTYIQTQQNQIGESENMLNGLKAFECIISFKMEFPSEQPKRMNKIKTRVVKLEFFESVSDKSFKELEQIIKALKDTERNASSGTQTREYIRKTLPRTLQHVESFRDDMKTKYNKILQLKTQELTDDETHDLLDFLESTRVNINQLQSKIEGKMVQGINDIMTEQTALSHVQRDLNKLNLELAVMDKQLEELQREERWLNDEANELEKIAFEKNKEKNEKERNGLGGVGMAAVGVGLGLVSGGLSIAITGAASAIMAYNFISAADCEKTAKEKKQLANKVRDEQNGLQSNIKDRKFEIDRKKTVILSKQHALDTFKADQDVLKNILNQLAKYVNIIHRLTAVLRKGE